VLSEEYKNICHLLADVMDYPDDTLRESAKKCAQKLEVISPGTSGAMQSFARFVQTQNTGKLEEIYTQTFEFNPAATLYVGYHIFGGTPKRSSFMTRLKGAYQFQQFSLDSELPDHLCVLLRFLGTSTDPEFTAPLVQEAILPALKKIEKTLSKNDNCYTAAVSSIRSFLKKAYDLKKEEDGDV
jgi:nitrate reductase molybdenum cofactor assembly chaperone NarJ/NarW